MPWGFQFLRATGVDNPEAPRHPAQIYEALVYLATFIYLMFLYWKKKAYKREGLMLGVLLIGVFAGRFIIEFFKENQEAFEEGMALNMGQILSIPFVLWGVYLIYRAFNRPPVDLPAPPQPKKKK